MEKRASGVLLHITSLPSKYGIGDFGPQAYKFSDFLARARQSYWTEHIEREKFLQYLFFKQWFSLKHYCNQHGIEIIGDIPIYVSYNSVEVWAHPKNFKLTSTKVLRLVLGRPP